MSEQLSPCPRLSLNCVCSRDDALRLHRVKPLTVSGDPLLAFARLKNLVAATARTVILTATEDYLHAACRTRIGFIDDLECRLCLTSRMIHIRSESRIGIYDFGTNRRRVERLRRQLQDEYIGG
ncbi:MAG: DUF1499 domain-containing protein [Nitrospira sp.]|nr:DUF1499 domain-containing protein [Nitrospira sp.]MDE0404748.1 DUF1499 domain-containing protein [Nitrospira sp.]MDE0485546.1 DUF1499 domain-containing protein [Nitrospira sp.]